MSKIFVIIFFIFFYDNLKWFWFKTSYLFILTTVVVFLFAYNDLITKYNSEKFPSCEFNEWGRWRKRSMYSKIKIFNVDNIKSYWALLNTLISYVSVCYNYFKINYISLC